MLRQELFDDVRPNLTQACASVNLYFRRNFQGTWTR